MSNSYFQFKEFVVKQEKCAMKVTTDGCLFGAWCAEEIKKSKVKSQNCLDIGSGTGLLSLMVEQKNDVKIDAIEIDSGAAQQCNENFSLSPWKNNLHVINDSLQHATHHQIIKSSNYQIIFSNPPFFDNDLKSVNDKRNLALHSSELSLDDLFECADQLLTANGNFFLLLPFHRKQEAITKAAVHNLFPAIEMLVRQTTSHEFFRVMLCLKRNRGIVETNEMSIKDENGYTDAFISLLKDYYLAF